jgi:hypothetical protein
MKKTLLTLALVALTTVASYAQGTIAFGNSALTRVLVRDLATGVVRGNATAQDGITFAVFFGAAGASRDSLTEVVQTGTKATIGTTDGVMINAPSVYGLPGTDGGQVVSLQIRAWDTATGGTRMIGETDVRQVTLGPAGSGPGAVIWQGAAGTNPNRFNPLIVNIVPEPSTIALAVLGLGSLLLFRRRK